MKRTVNLIVLSGLMTTVLLGVSLFPERRSGIVPKVHAQENEANRACTNASLSGPYGYYRTGTTPGGPVAAVGILTYDGKGFGTAQQTVSRNGVFHQDLGLAGSYRVNPDCTGTLFASDGVTPIAQIVLVNEGEEVFVLGALPGNTVYAVQKKIHPSGT
jgi:hypothetical protein